MEEEGCSPGGAHGARCRRLRGRPRPGRSAHPSAPAGTGGVRDGRDGTRAASLGGYTAVVAMPNTEPALDSAEAVGPCSNSRRRPRPRWRWPAPSPWAGPASGWRPWPSWPTSGSPCSPTTAPASSRPVSCAGPLDYATGLGVTLAQHCEDGTLAANGAMHEGEWSSRLGLPGMPAVAEEVMVARDIALVRAGGDGARIHFLHLSTAGSVEMVRQAKAEGLAVTAEAAPHHFSLTDSCTSGLRPGVQGQPPVATADRCRRGEGRPGRRDHRCHRHRPRPPSARAQGPALRPGPSGHARPADGGVPGHR